MRARTNADNARSVARALVAAEADGLKGHGLSRVPSYAAQAKAGKVDGFAKPALTRARPGLLAIDAANGFAFPALELAVAELPEVARGQGVAAAGDFALASLRRGRTYGGAARGSGARWR